MKGYGTEHLDQFVQHTERIEQLDRNFLEFQRTTTAALERMDRILGYLLRQQQGRSSTHMAIAIGKSFLLAQKAKKLNVREDRLNRRGQND